MGTHALNCHQLEEQGPGSPTRAGTLSVRAQKTHSGARQRSCDHVGGPRGKRPAVPRPRPQLPHSRGQLLHWLEWGRGDSLARALPGFSPASPHPYPLLNEAIVCPGFPQQPALTPATPALGFPSTACPPGPPGGFLTFSLALGAQRSLGPL